MASAAPPFAFQGVAVWPRRGRPPPAGAPGLHGVDHPVPQEAGGREYGGEGDEKEQGRPGVIGAGARAVWIEGEADHYGYGCDAQATPGPGGRLDQWSPANPSSDANVS